MANVIAVIWDFDRTLVDGYMQDPIFKNIMLTLQSFGLTWRRTEKML